jgi:hypothetical protein
VAASVQRLAATEEMAAAFGFSQQIRSAMIRRLEALVGRPMSDFDMLTMNRQDPFRSSTIAPTRRPPTLRQSSSPRTGTEPST